MSLSPTASDQHLVALAHSDLPYSRPPTPPASILRLGWLGLGAMGTAMVRNLASHHHSHPPGAPPILIYNRTKSRAENLAAELGSSVQIANSLGQLATECDVIYTCLSSDEAVLS